MAQTPIINALNAGELSPRLEGRTDLSKYYSGCRTCENFIVLPQGGIQGRPGTQYIATIKNGVTKKGRVIPFEFSVTQAYILEFTDLAIRFYKDGGQIVYSLLTLDVAPGGGGWSAGETVTGNSSEATCIIVTVTDTTHYIVKHVVGTYTLGEILTNGTDTADQGATHPTVTDSTTPAEVTTPYLEADLFQLKYEQSADVMYITHPSYHPQKLIRFDHDYWTLEDCDFTDGPFLAENDPEKEETVYTVDLLDTPANISVDAADGIYDADELIDDDITGLNFWERSTGYPHWAAYDFGVGVTKTITKYTISAGDQQPARMPKNWTFEGSATGAYGGEEVTLDTQTNQSSWATSERRDYIVTNSTAYRYYRLLFSAGNDAGVVRVYEIEMMETLSEATTITPSATTGNITLTASRSVFESTHVGSQWQLIHQLANSAVKGDFTAADQTSSTLLVYGTGTMTTHGSWTGEIKIQRSYDNGTTWTNYHFFKHAATSEANFNVSLNEEDEDVLYRLYMVSIGGAETCSYSLSVDDSSIKGVVRIDSYVSATVVNGFVLRTLGNTTATYRWSEGAWSDKRGYPAAICFTGDDRLVFAGSPYRPLTVWQSRPGEYENMRTGTIATAALVSTIKAGPLNAIHWITGERRLLVGTAGSEGLVEGTDIDEPMSPENLPQYKLQSAYGSKNLNPVVVADALMFVQRKGLKVRQFAYRYENDKYKADDVTLFHNHITKSGIVDMAYQRQSDSILWAVRDDGEMAILSFEPTEMVIGWTRIVTDGTFESIAIISGDTEDEIWAIVNRTISGSTARYIERFKPRDWGTDHTDCFFVDSGLTFDGGPAVNITAVTKANPGVVTCDSYPVDGNGDNLADGDQVLITGVVGMTELNDNVYTISNPNVGNKTFELRNSADDADVDTSGYGAWVSGGTVQRVENTFSGLGHLEAKSVVALGDGVAQDAVTVSTAIATYTNWFNKIHIGLGFTPTVKPMRIEIPLRAGSSQGRKKRIHEIVTRLFETMGATYGPDENTQKRLLDVVEPFSGDVSSGFPGSYETEGDVMIIQDKPYPISVTCIVPKMEVPER